MNPDTEREFIKFLLEHKTDTWVGHDEIEIHCPAHLTYRWHLHIHNIEPSWYIPDDSVMWVTGQVFIERQKLMLSQTV